MAADWRERVTVDPLVLLGKPVVRWTRGDQAEDELSALTLADVIGQY